MNNTDSVVTVDGNDAVDSGYVNIVYSRSASVSPLHLNFKRKDGYECSISLTHQSVKELMKMIVNHL